MLGDKRGVNIDISVLARFKNGVAKRAWFVLPLIFMITLLSYIGYVFATSQFVMPGASPVNDSWSTSASVSFQCNVSVEGDNASIANVSIFSNMTGAGWFFNASNSSAVVSNVTTTITVNPVPDGQYNWSCGVWEVNSSGGGTPTLTSNESLGLRVLKVDTTAPVLYNLSVSNISGLNGFISNAASAAFAVSVIETNNITTNVSMYYRRKGSAWDFTNKKIALTCTLDATLANYWRCSKSSQDLRAEVGENQVLEFFFNATDEAGNGGSNGSSTSYWFNATVDSNPPIINWFNATGFGQTNNWSNTNSIIFYVNITDNNTVNNAACKVYYNGTGNSLVTNVTNVTIASYTSDVMASSAAQRFADNSYRWNITCNDSAGNVANTLGAVTLNVDATAPAFSNLGPSDDTWNSTITNMNASFTITDKNTQWCSFWTNDTTWAKKNSSYNYTSSGGDYNFTYTFSADGSYVWNVECNDTAGNSAFNANNFTVNVDATSPTINWLNSTGYNKGIDLQNWSSSSSIIFYVNATDNNAEANNAACVIYSNYTGDWTLNTTFVYSSDKMNASSAILHPDGSYGYNVTCNDSAGNKGQYGSKITLNVDATPPSVDLAGPVNDTFNNSRSVIFNFTIEENNLDTCFLYTNETSWGIKKNATATQLTLGNNFTYAFSTDGNFKWNVYCNDSAANTNMSGTNEGVNGTVKIDATAPILVAVSPLNSTYINSGISLLFNVSVIEKNMNITYNLTVYYKAQGAEVYKNANTTCLGVNGAGGYDYHCSVTVNPGLGDTESVLYIFNMTDMGGNGGSNGTEIATLIATVDSSAPTINWANQTAFGQTGNRSSTNSVIFYANTSDPRPDSCVVYYNATATGWTQNVTFLYSTNTMNASSAQVFADGHYRYNITCNDTVGNIASLRSNITFEVDGTVPVVRFVNATGYKLGAYPEQNWSNTKSIRFYYNTTENNVDTCTLFTNVTGGWLANTSDGAVNTTWASNVMASVNVSFTSDGSYLWNVKCNDSAGGFGFYSSNMTVNIDSSAPTINIINQTGYAKGAGDGMGNWSSSSSIIFYANATDSNPVNCTVLYNATAEGFANNVTFAYTSNAMALSAAQVFADGSYHYNVTCNDTSGNAVNYGSNITFNVDATAPLVNLSDPGNSAWNSTGSVRFTFNLSDRNSDSCVLYTNSSNNGSGSPGWAANRTLTSTDLTDGNNLTVSFVDGSYTWNVVCNDSATNNGSATANFTVHVDNSAPAINWINATGYNKGAVPAQNWSSSSSITFYVNATERNPSYCIAYWNATNGNITFSFTSDAMSASAASTIADGSYRINVSCNDTYGKWGSYASNITINVDATAPVLNIANQTGFSQTGNWSSTNSIIFYANATDINAVNCTVLYNASATGFTNNVTFAYTTDVTSASATQRFADGHYRYNVTCNDSAGNAVSLASNVTFKVDGTLPAVRFVNATGYKLGTYPEQNWSNTKSIRFYYNTTENNVDTCTLFTNFTGAWLANATAGGTVNTTWASDVMASVNVSFTSDGSYLWNVKCNDSAGGFGFYSSNMTVNIDSSAPAINWANQTGFQRTGNWSGSSVTFYANATDINPVNCTVYYNATATGWTRNVTFAYTSDVTSASAVQRFGDGSYRYNVTCNDSAGNAVSLATNVTFNVDATEPTLSSAEYYIPARRLNLTFSDTVDASTLNLAKVNITFSTDDTTNAPFTTSALTGATASGTDSTLIQINLTEAQNSALVTMIADSSNKYVNVSLAASAVLDSAENGVPATRAKLKYNSGYVNRTQVLVTGWNTLNIPTTSIMTQFEHPYSSSSTQSWNISVMLQSLGNNYNVIYYNIYNNASGWKVFTKGNWSTSTLQYVNNSNDIPYWINTTAANRWEI